MKAFDLTIYTLLFEDDIECNYCTKAKKLLDKYNIPYTEVVIHESESNEVEKTNKKNKMKTYPQIILNNELVGGYNDLKMNISKIKKDINNNVNFDEWVSNDKVNFLEFIDKYFKKYKEKKRSDINCKTKKSDDNYVHQDILKDYISDNTPYRGILIYHGLGTGKTHSAINIAKNTKRNVVVLLPASLKKEWINELVNWGGPEYKRSENYNKLGKKDKDKEDKLLLKKINEKYTFISHNASNTLDQLEQLNVVQEIGRKDDNIFESNLDSVNVLKSIKKTGGLDGKLLIVDEVHNMINNIISPKTKKGEQIYNTIMNARNLKLVFLSGTPVIKDPYELAILFNLLRGKMFVKGDRITHTAFPNYHKFYEYFVGRDKNIRTIKNKYIFQDRINGLVSYFKEIGDEDKFTKIKINTELIKMSDYQWQIYASERMKELEQEGKIKTSKTPVQEHDFKKPFKDTLESFRIGTRQLSNFVFPLNIKRPQPKQKDETITIYKERVHDAINNLTKEDLTTKLGIYSPKMKIILDKINKCKGLVFVYSHFLTLEGLGIFSRVLEINGYERFNPSDSNKKNKKPRFAIYSGDEDVRNREIIIRNFNNSDNKYGDNLKVLMATSAGAEGLNLRNVRQLHIMEPYWHYARIEQVIGRVRRLCSHVDLPKSERFVDVYIYLAIPPQGVNPKRIGERDSGTTDMYLMSKTNNERKLIDVFLKAVKEMAIDCKLNFEDNKSDRSRDITNIEDCRTCVESDEKMYLEDIDKNMLYGSNCGVPSIIKLKTISYNGKKYGVDQKNNVYDLSKKPYLEIGKWNGKSILFDDVLD